MPAKNVKKNYKLYIQYTTFQDTCLNFFFFIFISQLKEHTVHTVAETKIRKKIFSPVTNKLFGINISGQVQQRIHSIMAAQKRTYKTPFHTVNVRMLGTDGMTS